MDPHDYVCQYDLNTVQMHLNGHHPSAVYRAVCQALTAMGWIRYQFSCWRKVGAPLLAIDEELLFLAAQLELRFGAGVIRRFEFQRYVVSVTIR